MLTPENNELVAVPAGTLVLATGFPTAYPMIPPSGRFRLLTQPIYDTEMLPVATVVGERTGSFSVSIRDVTPVIETFEPVPWIKGDE